MLDAGLNSPFIPECSPIPLRHGIALYSSSEVVGPIPDVKIGPQQMSITLNPMEPDIEITPHEARDSEETERIHEQEMKKFSTHEHLKQPETDQHAIEHPGLNTNLGGATIPASRLKISLVQEAAALAPFPELKQVAAVALITFENTQVRDLIDLWLDSINCL